MSVVAEGADLQRVRHPMPMPMPWAARQWIARLLVLLADENAELRECEQQLRREQAGVVPNDASIARVAPGQSGWTRAVQQVAGPHRRLVARSRLGGCVVEDLADLRGAVADLGKLRAGIAGAAVGMGGGPRLDLRPWPPVATAGGGGRGGEGGRGKSGTEVVSSTTWWRLRPRTRAASAVVSSSGSIGIGAPRCWAWRQAKSAGMPPMRRPTTSSATAAGRRDAAAPSRWWSHRSASISACRAA